MGNKNQKTERNFCQPFLCKGNDAKSPTYIDNFDKSCKVTHRTFYNQPKKKVCVRKVCHMGLIDKVKGFVFEPDVKPAVPKGGDPPPDVVPPLPPPAPFTGPGQRNPFTSPSQPSSPGLPPLSAPPLAGGPATKEEKEAAASTVTGWVNYASRQSLAAFEEFEAELREGFPDPVARIAKTFKMIKKTTPRELVMSDVRGVVEALRAKMATAGQELASVRTSLKAKCDETRLQLTDEVTFKTGEIERLQAEIAAANARLTTLDQEFANQAASQERQYSILEQVANRLLERWQMILNDREQ